MISRDRSINRVDALWRGLGMGRPVKQKQTYDPCAQEYFSSHIKLHGGLIFRPSIASFSVRRDSSARKLSPRVEPALTFLAEARVVCPRAAFSSPNVCPLALRALVNRSGALGGIDGRAQDRRSGQDVDPV